MNYEFVFGEYNSKFQFLKVGWFKNQAWLCHFLWVLLLIQLLRLLSPKTICKYSKRKRVKWSGFFFFWRSAAANIIREMFFYFCILCDFKWVGNTSLAPKWLGCGARGGLFFNVFKMLIYVVCWWLLLFSFKCLLASVQQGSKYYPLFSSWACTNC